MEWYYYCKVFCNLITNYSANQWHLPLFLFSLKLEDEVEKLLGDHRGLVYSDQALKLSRLMVRAETTDQRIMLLKILQVYLIPSSLLLPVDYEVKRLAKEQVFKRWKWNHWKKDKLASLSNLQGKFQLKIINWNLWGMSLYEVFMLMPLSQYS